MTKRADDVKPIPYQTLWLHMSTIVTEREITLNALIADVDHPFDSTRRKELEGRIRTAMLICHLIDWCASHADAIDDIRRRERKQTAKVYEETNA
jgi:hypothetical protein